MDNLSVDMFEGNPWHKRVCQPVTVRKPSNFPTLHDATQASCPLANTHIDGHPNVYTSQEHPAYYGKDVKKGIPRPQGLSVIPFEKPRFDIPIIERERDVNCSGTRG